MVTCNESLARQKSRARWVEGGDRNTSYFHACVNWRRCWGVKLEVARFFEERFKEVEEKRPKLDGVKFKTISREDNNMLKAFF